MTLIQEFDKIINILEAEIPANPESPKNQRARSRFEKVLAKYFIALSNAFPYQRLGSIYNKNVKESVGSDSKGILNPLLATFSKQLKTGLTEQLTEIYISGQAEMISWGKTKAGIPIAYEGPPVSQAISWAESHISEAKLVDGLNVETRKQLSNVIADGIRNKRGIPGIKSDIRHKLEWMARGKPSDIKGLTLASRAELIARTETAKALGQSSLDNMKSMGINGKEWITSGDDRVSDACLANEAEGVIPVDREFSGGVMTVPQHPDCRCVVAPARLKK